MCGDTARRDASGVVAKRRFGHTSRMGSPKRVANILLRLFPDKRRSGNRWQLFFPGRLLSSFNDLVGSVMVRFRARGHFRKTQRRQILKKNGLVGSDRMSSARKHCKIYMFAGPDPTGPGAFGSLQSSCFSATALANPPFWSVSAAITPNTIAISSSVA